MGGEVFFGTGREVSDESPNNAENGTNRDERMNRQTSKVRSQNSLGMKR